MKFTIFLSIPVIVLLILRKKGKTIYWRGKKNTCFILLRKDEKKFKKIGSQVYLLVVKFNLIHLSDVKLMLLFRLVRVSHTQWHWLGNRWECPMRSDFLLGERWECTTHNDFCLVRCESVQHTMTFVWWDCPTPSDFFLERGESVPNTVTFAHLFGDSVPHKTAIKGEWHLTLVWWPWPLVATGFPTAATVPGTSYYSMILITQ